MLLNSKMVRNGEDSLEKKTDIRTIGDVITKKPVPQDGHYFYVLQMPACGQKRIKLGKTANIYARFAYYQAHFHGSQVELLFLRKFPRQKVDRYEDGGLMLYGLFEKKVKEALRDLNKTKNKNGEGKITEWFDSSVKDKLQNQFKDFVNNKFEKLPIEKTQKKELTRERKVVEKYKPTP